MPVPSFDGFVALHAAVAALLARSPETAKLLRVLREQLGIYPIKNLGQPLGGVAFCLPAGEHEVQAAVRTLEAVLAVQNTAWSRFFAGTFGTLDEAVAAAAAGGEGGSAQPWAVVEFSADRSLGGAGGGRGRAGGLAYTLRMSAAADLPETSSALLQARSHPCKGN